MTNNQMKSITNIENKIKVLKQNNNIIHIQIHITSKLHKLIYLQQYTNHNTETGT